MKEHLQQLFSRFGQTITLEKAGKSFSVKAFLQPITREREAAPVSLSPLGAVSRHRWLLLAPAVAELSPGDGVKCMDMSLVVQEARPVLWREQILYQWAILRRRKEARP